VSESDECSTRKELEAAVAAAKDTVQGAKLAATGDRDRDRDLTALLLEAYARQRKAVRELEDTTEPTVAKFDGGRVPGTKCTVYERLAPIIPHYVH
jgi:hypothetical protein